MIQSIICNFKKKQKTIRYNKSSTLRKDLLLFFLQLPRNNLEDSEC